MTIHIEGYLKKIKNSCHYLQFYASLGNSLSDENNFAEIYKTFIFFRTLLQNLFFLCHLTTIIYIPIRTTVSHCKIKQAYNI